MVWNQVETYLPTSQLPHWSLETVPLLQTELFGLWQSHGRTFRKVTISCRLNINAWSMVTHVDPHFKDSPQPLKISQEWGFVPRNSWSWVLRPTTCAAVMAANSKCNQVMFYFTEAPLFWLHGSTKGIFLSFYFIITATFVQQLSIQV